MSGFKAPKEWYDRVKAISAERHMTVGAAIQYVFNLGLPIYERVRKAELNWKQTRLSRPRRERLSRPSQSAPATAARETVPPPASGPQTEDKGQGLRRAMMLPSVVVPANRRDGRRRATESAGGSLARDRLSQ